MRRAPLKLGLLAALLVGGCGDDSAGADGDGDGTAGTESDGNDVGDDDDDDDDNVDDTSGDDPCADVGDCDDDNPCSEDSCSAGVCEHEAILSRECRPRIDVEYPQRAATILGEPGESVTVVGNINTGHGDVESLEINGSAVAFDDNGDFTWDVDPIYGGNTLVLDIVDSNGWERRRVQSFLWSTNYHLPSSPPNGMSPEGILIYISQETIDDGDRTPPIDDLGSLLGVALETFDIGQFISTDTVVASQAGYDVYLTDINFGSTEISLTAIDGGVRLNAAVGDIVGDLEFDCTNAACLLAGGDSTGGLSVEIIEIQADLLLEVTAEHTIDVDLLNVQTSIDPDDVELWSNNGWTNFLISLIEPFILDGIVADLADELNSQLYAVLGPGFGEALSGLNLSTALDLPNLANPDETITIGLNSDFNSTDFHDGASPPEGSPPQGGLLAMRSGGYPADVGTDYENLGIPDRMGCGTGDDSYELPRVADLEIGLTNAMQNQLLFGAWRGGLLEFPLPMSDDEEGGLISDLEVTVSGMLAPTASDCNDEGRLLAHIGDLRIDASLSLNDAEINFVAFSAIEAEMQVAQTENGFTLTVPAVESVVTELTVEQDDQIISEPTLLAVLEMQLQTLLVESLSSGFGEIALPEIDLSDTLGLDPGSAVLTVNVDEVGYADGVTIISGSL